jgi:Predicted oxidoreductases of the aldo/keto reductase family
MQKVILGKTGLEIGRVGFGGIPIQKVNANVVRQLLISLKENGGNYIDTARGYTVSEEFLGKALKGMRDDFVIATKSMARGYEDMKRDIDISLNNLQTDYIDLYQVHNPSLEQLNIVISENGALQALKEAKEEGKIGHIGLTAHSIEVFKIALDMDWIETIMFPFNIVENQGLDCIRQCKEKDIGFIAMKPLAGGAIEDGTLALRYIASYPEVTVIIPGMASLEEVEENTKAINNDGPLSQEENANILKIKEALKENFCRRCNYCAPCSVNIQIPSVFLFAGYLQRYDLGEWANDRYNSLEVKADACIECGACETRCPYHLPIREMLKKASADFKAFNK